MHLDPGVVGKGTARWFVAQVECSSVTCGVCGQWIDRVCDSKQMEVAARLVAAHRQHAAVVGRRSGGGERRGRGALVAAAERVRGVLAHEHGLVAGGETGARYYQFVVEVVRYDSLFDLLRVGEVE